MKIVIKTIPHRRQRYPTAGDFVTGQDGTLRINVSKTGSETFDFLIAIHELIEAKLCQHAGVPERSIDAFDMKFEKDRAKGKHGPDDEPGDHPKAPYRRQHLMATAVEKMMAAAMGVDWKAYDAAVNAL
jgi:hypothetical protein